MRRADASRRVVDVADRHFPVIQRHIRQVVLEHRRGSRRRSRPGLRLRLGVTTGGEQFGEQRERGNGFSTSHRHGQDYILPPVNQKGSTSDGCSCRAVSVDCSRTLCFRADNAFYTSTMIFGPQIQGSRYQSGRLRPIDTSRLNLRDYSSRGQHALNAPLTLRARWR